MSQHSAEVVFRSCCSECICKTSHINLKPIRCLFGSDGSCIAGLPSLALRKSGLAQICHSFIPSNGLLPALHYASHNLSAPCTLRQPDRARSPLDTGPPDQPEVDPLYPDRHFAGRTASQLQCALKLHLHQFLHIFWHLSSATGMPSWSESAASAHGPAEQSASAPAPWSSNIATTSSSCVWARPPTWVRCATYLCAPERWTGAAGEGPVAAVPSPRAVQRATRPAQAPGVSSQTRCAVAETSWGPIRARKGKFASSRARRWCAAIQGVRAGGHLLLQRSKVVRQVGRGQAPRPLAVPVWQR